MVDVGERRGLSDDERVSREAANPRQRNRYVEDLSGRKFNKLTVVSRADDYINPQGARFVQWNCVCDCGKTCVKRGTALTSGKALSCGCARSSSMRGKGLIDLSGRTFGKWHVIERAEDRIDSRGKHWPMWLCECECGTRRAVDGSRLRGGHTTSCGCDKVRKRTERAKAPSERKPRKVKNPMSEELAAQLVDPSLAGLSAKSHRKVEWRCEHGHTWIAEVAARTCGSGCPYCSGRIPIPGENDLATTHPDIARQLKDPSLGTMVGAGSTRKLEWVCDVDSSHVWSASVRNRTGVSKGGRGTGCPYCSKHANRSEHRLGTVADERPDLLASAANPEYVAGLSLGSGKVVSWVCTEHGEPFYYSMSLTKRRRGSGCPVCAGRVVSPGINDLATTHPDLAAELVNPVDGLRYSAGSDARLEWRCSEGHTWKATVSSRVSGNGCPSCFGSVSGSERELADAVCRLMGLDVEVQRNVRGLLSGRFELDVVVPSRHVAIEFNGLYWHSVDAGKSRTYHRDKFEMARDAGYQLIQVWEDDWRNRRDVVMRMLAAKLGESAHVDRAIEDADPRWSRRLFARKLSFGEIDGSRARKFMEENHIQGAVTATRHFALMLGSEPVAVMSLRSPRNSARTGRRDGEWEIQRYATCGMVVGGFSKLLANAERALLADGEDVREWVSFSDNCVSDGSLYRASGFVVDRIVDPDYKYAGRFTNLCRKSKESFQRRRFRETPELLWDEGWTEWEAAENNGLWRIYDAGKVRWRKVI